MPAPHKSPIHALSGKFLIGDGCWPWTAGLSRGYPYVAYRGQGTYGHRLMYEAIVGPIPEGLNLDHLCRNPICVRPDHLEPVTQFENCRRGLKGELKTHCKHGHPWIPENIYVRTNGHQMCKVCPWERRQGIPHPDEQD